MIKDYTNFSMEAPGCHPGTSVFRAHFKLDTDVSSLFPYINAVAEKAKYYKSPHYIQFLLKGIDCALYADEVIARVFENREQALVFFDHIKGFINDIESNKESITPNYKKQEYIPVLEILKCLPKSNCKECGFPTCMAFADAVSKGDAAYERCPKYERKE
ncbi:MAG: (Fe-S)-binding protein [Spirochaetota bacterium]|nr:(Fe-S)-binding protein [Spirochaetota bacterium]